MDDENGHEDNLYFLGVCSCVCALTPAYLRGQGYGNTPEQWGVFSGDILRPPGKKSPQISFVWYRI